MRVTTVGVGVVLVTCAGCHQPAAPVERETTMDFAGYHFTFAHPEGTVFKTEGHRNDDGAGHVDEDITASCGAQVLHVVNGALTLNGADRGTVKPGDSIKLTAAGKLWVNGQPRGQ
jgi:hypothetical protein